MHVSGGETASSGPPAGGRALAGGRPLGPLPCTYDQECFVAPCGRLDYRGVSIREPSKAFSPTCGRRLRCRCVCKKQDRELSMRPAATSPLAALGSESRAFVAPYGRPESLLFGWPKRSNQEKGHPGFALRSLRERSALRCSQVSSRRELGHPWPRTCAPFPADLLRYSARTRDIARGRATQDLHTRSAPTRFCKSVSCFTDSAANTATSQHIPCHSQV